MSAAEDALPKLATQASVLSTFADLPEHIVVIFILLCASITTTTFFTICRPL